MSREATCDDGVPGSDFARYLKAAKRLAHVLKLFEKRYVAVNFKRRQNVACRCAILSNDV